MPGSSKQANSFLITHQELRVLCIWAENWANQHHEKDPSMLRVVHGIAGDLQMQFPGVPSLTLAGEIADLRQAFPTSEITTVNVPEFEKD